jgi:type VI secretion system secreted protein VgrG
LTTSATTSGTVLPEVGFRFTTKADESDAETEWPVLRVRATEALSELYTVTLDLAWENRDQTPEVMLARSAVLTLTRTDGGTEHKRRLCGVVQSVEDLGSTNTRSLARVRVVPRLWTLSLRFGSRVYQNLSTPEIVRSVLTRAGLYPKWSPDAELSAEYPRRELCVQYRESDLDFILRLMEHEGIGFYFAHGSAQERLVTFDRMGALRGLHTMDHGDVPVAGDRAPLSSIETVRRFDWTSQVTPTHVSLRDFDFTRPIASADMTHTSVVGSSVPDAPRFEGQVYDYPGRYTLQDYEGGRYTRHDGPRLAGVRAQELRAQGSVGQGQSNLIGCSPGHAFTLSEHQRPDLNRRYAVVRVEHRGEAPEVLIDETEAKAPQGDDRYHNRFAAVDAAGPWRPRRATPWPFVRGSQTATVVGPPGEEIYTDEHGRIKVLFHWDWEEAAGDRASDEDLSSCWIRVAQSWSGGGWGAQFIPRVGMEVVVTFLEGDPDRPLVTGCVYNGTHPPPFGVPAHKTRSGLRTQSSTQSHGFNELSFEDAAGSEQVYLRAQRDLDEVVLRDHSARVGRDDVTQVTRNQSLHVAGDQSARVDGNRRDRVSLDHAARVDGNRETAVGQDETLRVEGHRYTVSAHDDQVVRYDLTTRVGGRERREVTGMSDLHVKDDLTTRVEGNHTTVVGTHDARRTCILHAEGTAIVESSDRTEILSDKELILRVGASRIRVTDERIELMGKESVTLRSGNTLVQVTPAKARVRSRGQVVISGSVVNAMTDVAQVKLTHEARITGAKVMFNPPKVDTDTDEAPAPVEVTRIELKDEAGRAIPARRFVLHLGDGSEIAGVLDHEGVAELEVEGSDAKVTFPEVIKVKPG